MSCVSGISWYILGRVESKPSKPANITRAPKIRGSSWMRCLDFLRSWWYVREFSGLWNYFWFRCYLSSWGGTSPHHMALSENGKYMKIPSLLVIFMEKMMIKQWTEWAFSIFSPYSKPCLTRSKSETGSGTPWITTWHTKDLFQDKHLVDLVDLKAWTPWPVCSKSCKVEEMRSMEIEGHKLIYGYL